MRLAISLAIGLAAACGDDSQKSTGADGGQRLDGGDAGPQVVDLGPCDKEYVVRQDNVDGTFEERTTFYRHVAVADPASAPRLTVWLCDWDCQTPGGCITVPAPFCDGQASCTVTGDAPLVIDEGWCQPYGAPLRAADGLAQIICGTRTVVRQIPEGGTIHFGAVAERIFMRVD